MQQTFYSGVDRYYEVFCGKGDTVELEQGPNNVVTLTVVSCTISEISCRDELGAEVNVNRKYILSMAHACHQTDHIEVLDRDLVSVYSTEGKPTTELGVVTKVNKFLATVFFLTGLSKLEMREIWVKSLRFIGRGFNIDKYFELKENKFSLGYKSLFTYLSKTMMPSQFQEEMGIPKLVYEIGGHFPIVASISGRLFDSNKKYAHDDLETVSSSSRKKNKAKRRLFSSVEGSVFDFPSADVSPISLSAQTSPVPSTPQSDTQEDDMISSVIKTYRNTRDRLVKMWLNINEKVSPHARKMKEDSKERYFSDSQETAIESAESIEEDPFAALVSFPQDSTHYTKYLSGNKKSDLYRSFKSTNKQLSKTRRLHYTGSTVRLVAIPLCTEYSSRDRKVRFSVHVSCHEYPSY